MSNNVQMRPAAYRSLRFQKWEAVVQRWGIDPDTGEFTYLADHSNTSPQFETEDAALQRAKELAKLAAETTRSLYVEG